METNITFKGFTPMITKHFDFTPHTTYLEFLLPDGRFFYYEFEPNHKIREKSIWYFGNIEHT